MRCYSAVGLLPMSPAINSSRLRPPRMSQTAFVIGISTPTRSDSSRRTGAVVRPSTVPICAAASLRGGPSGDQLAGAPVSAVARPASDDQVADSRQPGEGLRAPAGCLAEAGHLGQAAGDDRGLRVVAELEAVDPAGRERDHVLSGDRSLFQRRGADPVEPDLREMLRIPSCLRDRSRLFRIAGNECHIVPPLGEEAGEGGAPRSRPDHDRVHERLTKSMATGTPSSSKRARSRFSTQ